eukprot:CAMPEP_0196807500 /NCGR_PEP_ID=MMETSP1362-20130617/7478_1 /TAXON_ID=163516 /ORGANISM="Leptocylindrus danicus, Strain CCMP1856" /LENGTH=690 /DNA_ID=CAMNT_0042181449 /DNA_START=101 /DNA_END=2173 /DNA_ORIENTATION=-
MQHLTDTARKVQGAEVIFTFLESLTQDMRDISTDYKLSGPFFQTLPTPGAAEFLVELTPECDDIRIPKTSCSVFLSTNIDYVLRNLGMEQLVIIGQLTDQCVESAVRDAADLGYLVTVPQDACVAKSEDEHKKGLHGMRGFANIVSTEDVISDLLAIRSSMPVNDDTVASKIATSGTLSAVMKKSEAKTAANTEEHLSIESSFFPATTRWEPPPLESSGAVQALYHALSAAGVKYIRMCALDISNATRCKAVPLQRLMQQQKSVHLDNVVSIAEVSIGGIPTYADVPVPDSNLSAARVLPLHADLSSLRVPPHSPTSACVFGSLHDQVTGNVSPLCCRSFLRRVMKFAQNKYNLAFHVGAELEFCLYRDGKTTHGNFDGDDSAQQSRITPVDESLFAYSTILDEQEHFISEVDEQLRQINIEIELLHAESASGQLELVLPYRRDVLRIADDVVYAKETIQSVAKKHGMRALFLPKIKSDQAGNGLHVHISFRDLRPNTSDANKSNAFHDGCNITYRGKGFMEGILEHLPALLSLTIPSVNSFRRVGPGCWTGHTASWATEDKEAPLRVCLSNNEHEHGNSVPTLAPTNVEFKLLDATANIYLALGAVLLCGLDGIERNLTLRPELSKSSVSAPLPTTFAESIECLKNDSFLLSFMGEELSTAYLAVKVAEERHFSTKTLQEEVLFDYVKS